MVTINVKSELTGRNETYISECTPGFKSNDDVINNGLRLLGCNFGFDDITIEYEEFNGKTDYHKMIGRQRETDNIFTITVAPIFKSNKAES